MPENVYEEKDIKDVIQEIKKHNNKADEKLIMHAYNFAVEHHNGQLRKSGEPYIIHPVQVAYIAATLGLDSNAIAASLMHDLVEDTDVTLDDIRTQFSDEIAEMVDGVTKLGKIKYASHEELLAENYRKMFLAMGKDIRVILIKLSDRLHNMRTLEFLPGDRQIVKAKETINLYAPLANRLRNVLIKMGIRRLSFQIFISTRI